MNAAEKPAGLRRTFVKNLGKKLFRGAFLEFMAKQSRVPNDPVLDAAHFPWAESLRANWEAIRGELEAQLRNRASLPNFQDISPDQYRISPDAMWKTFVFYGFGDRSTLGCELCPETARALAQVPRLESAFFSLLAPGKHIPRHRGVTKGMVRCHLALSVPVGEERCAMDVGGVTCTWRDGELLFFDDTYPHEVWNDTKEERAVLLFDFERPMKWPGRILSRLMMRALRHTAYFKDAQRNQRAWEERYREVLSRSAA